MELAGFVLAVVFTLIAVVTFVSVALIRSRRRLWARFARRHGLTYQSDAARITVEGTVQQRPFQLFTPNDSSDVGPLGVQEVRMELGLRGNLPPDTMISRVQGWVGAVDRITEAEAVPTGDEQFDRQVLVESRAPDQALRYLTPPRRELIKTLVSDAHADDAGVEDSVVFIQDREMLTNLDRIEERLQLMLRLAPGLDAMST
jgi:hypothetical protein